MEGQQAPAGQARADCHTWGHSLVESYVRVSPFVRASIIFAGAGLESCFKAVRVLGTKLGWVVDKGLRNESSAGNRAASDDSDACQVVRAEARSKRC